VDDLTPEQRYLAEETVDHARDGVIDRREMGRRLLLICGSAAAATSLLAACGGDGSAVTSPSTTGPGTTSTGPGTTSTTTAAPTTTASNRPALSVAADDPAVRGAPITLTGPAGPLFAYRAEPSAAGTAKGGIVVIHEIFGLTEHIRDVARRLAKAGYVALALDLTSRAGGMDRVGAGGVSGALGQTSADDLVADLRAGADALVADPRTGGRLGVTGFCFGGGMTLRLAAADVRVGAAVPYYGPTPQPASIMGATRAAVLAHYGATDSRINAGIADLEAAMVGKTFEKVVWDGAGHAFNNDTGGNYRESVAVPAWARTLDWFARHLR
jgi:carboxymethylenebutenolidase